MTPATHESLRKVAVKWLSISQRCSVVLSELVSAAGETPDAIGWRFGSSILVECKVSRSDFHANKNKPSVRSERGVGKQRYFLCPAEMIQIADLADSDYGLLWLHGSGRVSAVREPVVREPHHVSEILMLTSALRRIKTREFLTINILDGIDMEAE